MNSKIKKSKTIPHNKLPFIILYLHSLKDGRVAIGGYSNLIIYNMESYNIDIKIELDNESVKFIHQLNDNKLFYYTYKHESEGPHTDEYFYNYLIDILKKT